MKTITSLLAATFLLLLGAPAVQAAPTVTYGFSVAGFSGGGTLSGSFSGTDANGDGHLILTAGSGELSTFSLTFDGDADVSPFTLDLGDIVNFLFDLDNGPVWGDGGLEGLEAISTDHAVLLGPGGGVEGVWVEGMRATSEAANLPQLRNPDGQPVDEPAAAALVALGLLLLSGARRRHSAMRSGLKTSNK